MVSQFVTGLPGLTERVTHSVDSLRNWLINGPAHLSRGTDRPAGDSVITAMQNNRAKLTSGALSTAATVTELVTGVARVLHPHLLLARRPQHLGVRHRDRSGRCAHPGLRRRFVGFHSLIGYVRATFVVALVDAVGIGAGATASDHGVPLALPLASLVFLGAFIPLVGAVVTGFLAVVVALLTWGFIYA